MREVLTPPFLLAAGVLLLAGAAKLRSPGPAARAMRTLGLPGRRIHVRGVALGEIALGAVCVLAPTQAGALALASLYVVFAVLSTMLAHRQASCGCFGEAQGQAPASAAQSVLSGVLALACVLSAARPPHSLGWVLDRPLPSVVALTVGILGAIYAAMITYTSLPQAWSAWSAR